MPAFPLYLVFLVLWGLLGTAILRVGLVHPLAVGIVWIVGFVWLTGWFAAGPKDADALLRYWLSTLALIASAGAILFLILSPFT